MEEPRLIQRIEEKVLNRILAIKDSDEKDKSLTELLHQENIDKAKFNFYGNAEFQNYELNILYDRIMESLLQDIAVKEGKVVPKKIIEPEDRRFLELYSILAQLDPHFTNYKLFFRHNRADESKIELKLKAADERLKVVQERLKKAEDKKKDLIDKTNHEAIKLESEIERYGKEEKDIKEQVKRHESRISFFDKELERYLADSSLRSYFNSAFAKAKELCLEKSLSFEVPETGKKAEISLDTELLSRRVGEIPIEFIPFEISRKPRKIPFFKKWKKYILGAAAALVLGGVVAASASLREWWSGSETKVEGVQDFSKVASKYLSYDPIKTTLTWLGRDGLEHKTKLEIPNLMVTSRRYIPGPVTVKSFDPEKKIVSLLYSGGQAPEETMDYYLESLLKPGQLRDKMIDFQLAYYRIENGKLCAVTELVSLSANGKCTYTNFKGLPNAYAVDIPDEFVDTYAAQLAKTYRSIIPGSRPVDMVINGKPVIDIRYEHHKGGLTLFTSDGADHSVYISPRSEMDIRLPPKLRSTVLDNMPDAFITTVSTSGKKAGQKINHWLDLTPRGDVRIILPPENVPEFLDSRGCVFDEVLIPYLPGYGNLPGGELNFGQKPLKPGEVPAIPEPGGVDVEKVRRYRGSEINRDFGKER